MSANDLLTLPEVFATLGITRSTWSKWRARRIAPPAIRLPNGQLRVRRRDLDAWLDSQAA